MKKTFYAAVFFGGLTLVLFVVFFSSAAIVQVSRRESAEPSPSVAQYAVIELQNVSVIPHQAVSSFVNQTVDIVATLRNPNPRAGIKEYALTFVLYDASGEELARRVESTYVLPGSLQYTIALDVEFSPSARLGRVEVIQPSDPVFMRLPDKVDLPNFSSFLRERTTQESTGTVTDVQKGLVTNTSTLDWQRVEVSAVALDEAGHIIAAGKTFLGRLLVGEQREFVLQWPKPSAAITQIIVLPGTNIFSEENIIEIIGDPGSLR